MEEDWKNLDKERKLELIGYRYFNRYGEDDWVGIHSLDRDDTSLMEDLILEEVFLENKEKEEVVYE